jgi:hypothetical protein
MRRRVRYDTFSGVRKARETVAVDTRARRATSSIRTALGRALLPVINMCPVVPCGLADGNLRRMKALAYDNATAGEGSQALCHEGFSCERIWVAWGLCYTSSGPILGGKVKGGQPRRWVHLHLSSNPYPEFGEEFRRNPRFAARRIGPGHFTDQPLEFHMSHGNQPPSIRVEQTANVLALRAGAGAYQDGMIVSGGLCGRQEFTRWHALRMEYLRTTARRKPHSPPGPCVPLRCFCVPIARGRVASYPGAVPSATTRCRSARRAVPCLALTRPSPRLRSIPR